MAFPVELWTEVTDALDATVIANDAILGEFGVALARAGTVAITERSGDQVGVQLGVDLRAGVEGSEADSLGLAVPTGVVGQNQRAPFVDLLRADRRGSSTPPTASMI